MNPQPASPMTSSRGAIGLGLLLLVLIAAAYWSLPGNGFITYDDPYYVTKNPDVNTGLSLKNVKWAFTAMHASNWHPLTWISHMVDCELFGLDARAHHLANLGWHALNSLLLFALLRRLTGSTWRSWFVAALFAVHPMHVESVAWVSERKDVLSTFFFLLTLLAYARYTANTQPRNPAALLWYGLALLGFALGLLSKPMLVRAVRAAAGGFLAAAALRLAIHGAKSQPVQPPAAGKNSVLPAHRRLLRHDGGRADPRRLRGTDL